MYLPSLLVLLASSTLTFASPFKFPLANGFPDPSPDSIASIQKTAQGSLPNGPLPKSLGPDSVTALKLIAFGETFEVAFFTDLLRNITHQVENYSPGANAHEREHVVKALEAVIAVSPPSPAAAKDQGAMH